MEWPHNYQGQRCGRSHIADWAELGVPLAADLTCGKTDGRARVKAVLRRAPATLPAEAAEVKVRVPIGRLSPSLKARRRRTVPQGQLRLAFHKMVDHVCAYSFILTDLDVSTSAKAAEVEALNRDAKHGAALRHLPSGTRR